MEVPAESKGEHEAHKVGAVGVHWQQDMTREKGLLQHFQEISLWVLDTMGYPSDIGGCCFPLYQPQVSSGCCWIAASTSAQSLLFCKPFLAYQVYQLTAFIS